MKGSKVEHILEERNEYKKTIRGRVAKTYSFNNSKKWLIGTLPKI